jgi:hypothetical protein
MGLFNVSSQHYGIVFMDVQWFSWGWA